MVTWQVSGYPRMSHHWQKWSSTVVNPDEEQCILWKTQDSKTVQFLPLAWKFWVKQAIQLPRSPGTPVEQCGQRNAANHLLEGFFMHYGGLLRPPLMGGMEEAEARRSSGWSLYLEASSAQSLDLERAPELVGSGSGTALRGIWV
jgi:hypothetical protein